MFMVLITLIAAEGWTGLLITFGVVPLPAILLAVGMSLGWEFLDFMPSILPSLHNVNQEHSLLCHLCYSALCALGLTKQTELPRQHS